MTDKKQTSVPDKVFKFELPQYEINVIIDALMELPAKHSWNILKKLEEAMVEQSKEVKPDK